MCTWNTPREWTGRVRTVESHVRSTTISRFGDGVIWILASTRRFCTPRRRAANVRITEYIR